MGLGKLMGLGGMPGSGMTGASPPQPLPQRVEQQVRAGETVRANRQRQPVRTQEHDGNIRPGHRRNMAEPAELIVLPRGGTHQGIIPVGGTQNQCRRLRAEGVQGAGAQLLLERGQVRILRRLGGSVRPGTVGGRRKNSRAAQLRRGTVKLHRTEGGHLHARINHLRARGAAPLLLSRRARRRTYLQTLRGALCRTVTPIHAHPLIHQRTHAPPLNFLQLNNHQSSARIHAANLLHRAIQTKRSTLCLLQGGAGCIHPRSAQKHRLNRDNTRQKNQLTGRAKEQAVGHHRTRRKEQQNRQAPQQSNEHTRQRMHHPPRSHSQRRRGKSPQRQHRKTQAKVQVNEASLGAQLLLITAGTPFFSADAPAVAGTVIRRSRRPGEAPGEAQGTGKEFPLPCLQAVRPAVLAAVLPVH